MKLLDLEMTQQPGSSVVCWQCAECSHSYPFGVPDGQGDYTPARDAQDNEYITPDHCRRCGAPMSYTEVHKPGGYADQQAEASVNSVSVRSRRNRMMTQAPIAKA